jgi:transposase
MQHESNKTQCACGCQLQPIGEDLNEKLNYTSGVFTVEQHVHGKWACRQCETLIQAPVPAQVIDKGIPTAGLLANVMVAKFADHLPLYRQEKIFGRAGLPIARSTLARCVGQTGLQLQPLVDALRDTVLAEDDEHLNDGHCQSGFFGLCYTKPIQGCLTCTIKSSGHSRFTLTANARSAPGKSNFSASAP